MLFVFYFSPFKNNVEAEISFVDCLPRINSVSWLNFYLMIGGGADTIWKQLLFYHYTKKRWVKWDGMKLREESSEEGTSSQILTSHFSDHLKDYSRERNEEI